MNHRHYIYWQTNFTGVVCSVQYDARRVPAEMVLLTFSGHLAKIKCGNPEPPCAETPWLLS